MCGIPLESSEDAYFLFDDTSKMKIEDFIFPVALPVNLEKWEHGTAEHYIFSVKNGKAGHKMICSSCGAEFCDDTQREYIVSPQIDFEGKIICPNCGTHGKLIKTRKNTNYSLLTQFGYFDFLNKLPDRFLYQRYHYQATIDPATKKEVIDSHECVRETLINGKLVKCAYKYIYGDRQPNGLFEWKEKWQFASWGAEPSTDFFKHDLGSAKDWKSFISGSPIQYSMTQAPTTTYPWNVFMKMVRAEKYPWVEYVLKMGLKQLYYEILDGTADMIYTTPKNIKKFRKCLKPDTESRQLMTMRILEKVNIGLTENPELVKTLCQERQEREFLDFYRYYLYQRCTIFEWAKYYLGAIIGSKSYVRISTYGDYLDMLKQLNGPADLPNNLIFPKNIREAHDKLSDRIKLLKETEKAKTFEQKVYPKIKKLEYTNSEMGLAIVAPKQAADLTKEGAELHHCVGSYIDRVVSGSTVILFIRSIDDLQKPLGTLEWRDQRVVQCYGDHDKTTTLPPNYKDFLEDWQKYIKKQSKVEAAS